MKTFAIAVLAAALLLPTRGAAAEDRIALVIGNGAYRVGAVLANPPADARDVAAALQPLGFSVTLLVDAGLTQMESALLAFRTALAARPGAVALFYFAGHGIQSQGVNYLLPVDQDARTEQMLKRMAISAADVLEYMEDARTRVNLVFLDACRNNPFTAQFRSAARGLAVTGAAPPETLVVYSTAAGDVAEDGTGRNSPFMTALLGRIATPDVDVETMLRDVTRDVQTLTGTRQTPYRYSSLTAGFVFAPVGAAAASPQVKPAAGAVVAAQAADARAGQQPQPIRVERGVIVWGEERYTPNLLSGYESFLRAVETRGPTSGKVIEGITAYRRRRFTTGFLKVLGLGVAATGGILAAQAGQPLEDTERTALYAGLTVGVVLFGSGMIFTPGVPTSVVDACNAQIAR